MAHGSHGIRRDASGHHAEHPGEHRGEHPGEQCPAPRNIRIISWNLLHLVGAGVEDVAALVEQHRPDLLLMQEATADLAALPALAGGYFFREPLHGRIYGLAVWSPHQLPPPRRLPLPVSTMPGRVPPRVAQIIRIGNITFANVHLSHGQFLNRWQLLHVARSLEGPAAVVGDYNAVGPIKLAGLRDVGPRQPTHTASNIISLRLDRCMVRGLRCTNARVLERGPSDHHPIVLDLDVLSDARHVSRPQTSSIASHAWHGPLRVSVESWLRAVSQSPNRIRVSPGPPDERGARRVRRNSAEAERSGGRGDSGGESVADDSARQ
jgi:endonuclease/exonuclease/phosphatase (EEP) superfamily protein YafD